MYLDQKITVLCTDHDTKKEGKIIRIYSSGIDIQVSEAIIKFKKIKPKTMGQALRIDGITPAAVYILLSHVKRKSIKLIA